MAGGGGGWSMCEIVSVKKNIVRRLRCNFHSLRDEEDGGGFPVIVTLCRELGVAC